MATIWAVMLGSAGTSLALAYSHFGWALGTTSTGKGPLIGIFFWPILSIGLALMGIVGAFFGWMLAMVGTCLVSGLYAKLRKYSITRLAERLLVRSLRWVRDHIALSCELWMRRRRSLPASAHYARIRELQRLAARLDPTPGALAARQLGVRALAMVQVRDDRLSAELLWELQQLIDDMAPELVARAAVQAQLDNQQ